MTRQTRRTFLAATDAAGLAGCSSFTGMVPKSDNVGKVSGSGTPNVAIADDFESLDHWQAVVGEGSLSRATDAYEGSQCVYVLRAGECRIVVYLLLRQYLVHDFYVTLTPNLVGVPTNDRLVPLFPRGHSGVYVAR